MKRRWGAGGRQKKHKAKVSGNAEERAGDKGDDMKEGKKR